jgi:hypothetical protein
VRPIEDLTEIIKAMLIAILAKTFLEERPGHRLQRSAHPPVQLDLVVQRSEDMPDGALLGERRK